MDPLLVFRASNFRSISDTVELSLVASDKHPGVIESSVVKSGLLPVVGIYGGNASGKSSVISAFDALRRAVVFSHRSWDPDEGVPRNPHRFGPWPRRPTEFEIEFVISDVRFQYSVTLSDLRVMAESLVAYPSGRPQVWFRREADEYQFPGKGLSGQKRQIELITRSNSLFLSAGAQAAHPQLQGVAEWFSNVTAAQPERRPIGFQPGREAALARRLRSESERETILSFLRFADLGITDLRSIQEQTQTADGQLIFRDRLIFTHNDTPELDFNSRDESGGTLTWLDLVGSLTRVLRNGRLMVVDELDRSLHPLLLEELIRLFQDPERNPNGAQIVFTAHDTSLMDPRSDWPLRRDQVWLTEKDGMGATQLNPLLDYSIRQGQNLERWYRQGRFGAVPVLDDRELFDATSDALRLFTLPDESK